MGGGKGGGGKLPDYEQLIKDSAYYNRNTQIGPSGGLFWSPDRTTATQVLSPEAQAQLNLQNIISQYALGGLAGGMFGVTPEMLAAGTTVPWYQQGGVLGNNGGLGGGIEFPPNWNLDSNGPFYRELMAGGAGGAGGGYGATGAAGVPDFSLMPEGWTQGIDASQFLSNPFTNLDMAPEATNFLKGLLGTGGGGSNYSLSAGGGGGGMSLQGLAPLVSFDANGNPNIGPGLMSQLNLGSLPDFADAGDLMGARNRAEKAAFDRAMALINPEWDKRKTAMDESLLNRGIRGGEIQNQMQRDYDLGLNQAMSLAALDAVQGGREEYSFLSGEASKKRQQTLYERLTQANLQNQAQQMMAETNLGAYGAEAMARYQQGQLAESAAARAMAAQQQDLASRLQAASMLWSQNMGAYQQMFGNLAQLAGFGGGQGLAYSLGSPVDVTGASNSAMNNAMFGWQSSPLGIATELGGTLGSAALGGKG